MKTRVLEKCNSVLNGGASQDLSEVRVYLATCVLHAAKPHESGEAVGAYHEIS